MIMNWIHTRLNGDGHHLSEGTIMIFDRRD